MSEAVEFRINVNRDTKEDRLDTPMFDAFSWQLGPKGLVQDVDPDCPRPYGAYAYLDPNLRTSGAAHGGWSLLYVVDGSFTAAGKVIKKGDIRMGAPWSTAGDCTSQDDGCIEFCLYDDGAATLPYFVNREDPAYLELKAWFASRDLAFQEPEPPVEGFNADKFAFSLDKGRVETPLLDFKLFEVGPGMEVDASLPLSPAITRTQKPLFCHSVIKPGTEIPALSREGWTCALLLDGRFDRIDGTAYLAPGELLFRGPGFPSPALKVGAEGATLIMVYENGGTLSAQLADAADTTSSAALIGL